VLFFIFIFNNYIIFLPYVSVMFGKGKGKRSRLPENGENGHATNGCGEKRLCTTDQYQKNGHEQSLYALSNSISGESVKSKLSEAWKSQQSTSVEDSVAKVIAKPFTCCSVKSLVNSQADLEDLIEELNELQFLEKDNDLYKFKHSVDLNGIRSTLLKSLQRFFRSDVKNWLHEVTGIDFHDTVDMFCSRYDYTDYLLCHDDELEGRRIAYIWYLVPPSWKQEDGGTLDLFDMDENGHPKGVVHSLVPAMNSFVFFEVTHKSFHQVAEILTRDKTRLSIGGWFHAKGVERPEKVIEPTIPLELPIDIDEDNFFEWVNPMYLDPLTQLEIRENFESSSEICLKDFLDEDKYEEVCEALSSQNLFWSAQGPANKRRYDSLCSDDLPEIVQQCINFLKSDAMFLLLSNVTNLNLHHLSEIDGKEEEKEECDDDAHLDKSPKASSSNTQNGRVKEASSTKKPPSDPKCRSEIRRWRQGNYTLIHDNDPGQSEFALDARLFFNCKDWSPECGGFSSYVARDEDEELLSANPDANSLVLVYRDKDTLTFVKRVTDEANHKLSKKEFHDMSVVYYE
jgi:prolyl 3-hydroxylase /prolyl 3,4-dihydroxylase